MTGQAADPVAAYIRANFPRSFCRDAGGSGFAGIDLPLPYTTPSIRGEGKFSFFFYWDTFFTNLGLHRCGHADMARDNIRNVLWFIRRHGYMPNHVGLENRSQPPFLCRMVRDHIAATGDGDFLAEAAWALRQEYHFWATARHSPTGLQRHAHHETDEGLARFHGAVGKRLGLATDAPRSERVRAGGQLMAEAESGWDFTPRFEARCLDHNPVDLNALLYEYEDFLGGVSDELGWNDTALWQRRAARRRELAAQLLWNDERGLFLDHDFVNARSAHVASLAGFVPLFTGLATPEQAARQRDALALFERGHGLAATEETQEAGRWQWAFPNCWPPLVFMTVEGLARYGFHEDAARIAGKFVATQQRLFAETGRLWEKTDAVTGAIAAGEYEAAPMLGWTAGVYLAMRERLA